MTVVALHGHGNRPLTAVRVGLDLPEEGRQAFRRVLDVELPRQALIRGTDRHPMALDADIDGHQHMGLSHGLSSSSLRWSTPPTKILPPSRLPTEPRLGTIPADGREDTRDGGGNSEPSGRVCAADPVSHTPVPLDDKARIRERMGGREEDPGRQPPRPPGQGARPAHRHRDRRRPPHRRRSRPACPSWTSTRSATSATPAWKTSPAGSPAPSKAPSGLRSAAPPPLAGGAPSRPSRSSLAPSQAPIPQAGGRAACAGMVRLRHGTARFAGYD